VAQARRFGVEIIHPQEAAGLRIDGPYRILEMQDGSEISCHALVVATGLEYNKLNIPGVDALAGAGVFYGASLTEAASCAAAPVFTVGAGNSAGQAALHLAEFASQVNMLVRGRSLEEKMSQYLVERIHETANIQVLLQTEVIAAHGQNNLESLTVRNNATGVESIEPATALFIFVGAQPCTGWLSGIVEMDAHGFILSGPALMRDGKPPAGWNLDRDPFLLESSVPGVFVVGDVRSGSIKRVASAVGEGSISVQFIHQFLSNVK
jgi:thioredoxin reductase (NADPH)